MLANRSADKDGIGTLTKHEAKLLDKSDRFVPLSIYQVWCSRS